MAALVRLYAWAVPGFFSTSPVDHTWVTTYDNRIDRFENVQRVVKAKQCFWFCWGDFHDRGGTPVSETGFLGELQGNLAQARCLVQPNEGSKDVVAARGTIFRYGRDGRQPLTVAGARGYMFSSFRYGSYGTNNVAWRKKLDACGPGGRKTGSERRSKRMTQKPDDFETRARDVLKGENRELLPKLLALRTQTQRLSSQQWLKSSEPTAGEINARNQEMFDRAADLLGPENFRKIFGAPAHEEVNLVDPHFLSEPGTDHPTNTRIRGTVVVDQRATPAAATVTLKHLAAALAEDNSLSRRQAEAILGGLVGKVVKHLKKGERIRIGGLGVLQVRKRAARMGRNPTTGERIQIKASKKVAFRASKELKEAI